MQFDMRLIKRLHWLVLKSFLPLFAMTFFIVLFIVLMQFLWKYVDDLVGKGLEISVIAELFFYAAISMVPMSLPLAILLASLMTFGNFGEKFELTAMKASGISLLRVMMPLIIFISAIAVGAFFFQNNVLPKAQVKLYTLLFSMKQKSPEVEIPEGVFYDQIPGYNLYVGKKDKEKGTLYDVKIYDVSRGGQNATILLADSARLAFTRDSRYLYLRLMQGEQFENLRDQQMIDRNVPFRREEFRDKEILIPFDANFNRMDDQSMRKQYVGKNINELRHTIDSVETRLDSIGGIYGRELRFESYGGVPSEVDSKSRQPKPFRTVPMERPIDIDSLIQAMPPYEGKAVFSDARSLTRMKQQEYRFKSLNMEDDRKSVRRHEIELIKKFTLSIACLIFFFIGAPLGAIIRKGGIGTPLVISVLLFLVYYIIDNMGYKMARDGRWPVIFGMWISTMVLTPLGIFATYKAMNDSALFDKSAYKMVIRRMLGLKVKRGPQFKEVIINDISLDTAEGMLQNLKKTAAEVIAAIKRPMGYLRYCLHGLDKALVLKVAGETDDTVDYLADCRDRAVVAKLENFPIITDLWLFHPATRKWLGIAIAVVFPVGTALWIFANVRFVYLRKEMDSIIKLSNQTLELIQDDINGRSHKSEMRTSSGENEDSKGPEDGNNEEVNKQTTR